MAAGGVWDANHATLRTDGSVRPSHYESLTKLPHGSRELKAPSLG